jgi:hypothetical protein
MSTQDPRFGNGIVGSALPALGWIILAALVAVMAFLIAPLP